MCFLEHLTGWLHNAIYRYILVLCFSIFSQNGKATPPPLPERLTDSPRLGSTRREVNASWSAVNSSFQLQPNSSPLVSRPQLPLPDETKTKTPPLSIPKSQASQQKKFVSSISQTSTRSTDSQLSQFSPFSPTAKDWISPPSFQEAMASNSEYSPSSSPNLSPDTYLHPSLKRPHKVRQTKDYSLQSYLLPMTREEQEAQNTRPKSEIRMNRLRSVSCEDLSNYVKDIVYMPMDDLNDPKTNSSPPLPFPHIQSYVGSGDIDQRERSHSIDYYNVNLKGTIDSSPSPTVTELKRRYNTHIRTNLRKSVSNPNFIHALKKEMRDSKVLKSVSGTSPLKSKSKSRSLVSLLPENLRRRLSKDASKRDSCDSSNEDRGVSGRNSGSLPSSPPSTIKRQASSQSGINIKIKGITISETSRTFKRQVSQSPEKPLKQLSSDAAATNDVNIDGQGRGTHETRSPMFKKRDTPSPKLQRQNADASSKQISSKPKILDKPHNHKSKPVIFSKPKKDKATTKTNQEQKADKVSNGNVETVC